MAQGRCHPKGEALRNSTQTSKWILPNLCGARGFLLHSLLSSIRGSHVLEGSTAAWAGQAALQGAVAKPHVLHCDPAETWAERAL